MAETLTTALTTVTNIFTTNVVPLLKAEPFNYFLALSLFGVGCGIFSRVRNIV